MAALFASSLKPGDRAIYPPKTGEPSTTIYVLYNAVHSNIAVPTPVLIADGGSVAQAVARLPKPEPWTWVGWGDRKFYIEEGPFLQRLPDFARASFKPGNPSVVHLAGTDHPTVDAGHVDVLKLQVSAEGLRRLRARVNRALATRAGAPVIVAPGHAPDAYFFEGTETFSVLHLCNHWTGELLDAAGAPTTPVLDTLPLALGLDLRWRAKATIVPPPPQHPVSTPDPAAPATGPAH